MTCCFEYKCRRCGAITGNSYVNNELRALKLLADAIAGGFKEPLAPALFSLHYCNNTGTGISDLIGFKKES
jgi:hypothetical protein